jgi:hypothetical protein
MNQPIKTLNGKSPCQALVERDGADRIEELLTQIGESMFIQDPR